MYKTLLFEKTGKVGIVTLNRPEIDNAIDEQMAVEMSDICNTINFDKDIRVVIVTGAGDKAFSIGSEAQTGSVPPSVSESVMLLDCPVIAAINGDSLGQGLELAAACDIRIAASNVLFGLPQIKSGLMPSDGATQLLPRIVGKSKAMELILTGDLIDADEAYQVGLVAKVVPAGDVKSVSIELAQKMAKQSPLAMKQCKEAIVKGLDLTLEQGLRLEADLYFLLHTTDDRTEGIKAFQEKREPDFKGT